MNADDRRHRRPPLRPIESSEELHEELAQHLELLVARFVAQGMSPEAARAAAQSRFGDPVAVLNACAPIARGLERRSRLTRLLQELAQDVRFAFRSWRRAPLFACVAVLTLAVAIGSNTAMYSIVHAVLLRALPYAHVEQVDVLNNSYPGSGLLSASVAPPEFVDMKEALPSYDAFAALRPVAVNLAGDCARAVSCDPVRASGYQVSPNLFALLGATPMLGRAFTDDDGADGAPAVALISHDLWMSRFGGDSAAVGRTFTAAGVVRSIIGIMPRGVRFPDVAIGYMTDPADLWIPYNWERDRNTERGNQFLLVVARSAPGARRARHQAELTLLESRLKQDFASRYTGPAAWRFSHASLRSVMTGTVRPAILLLWAIVSMILLIACANVANLLLARDASRASELAVRAALGAGRGRLIRQLFAETLLIGAVAAVAGLLVASALLQVIRVLGPSALPQLATVQLDTAVLLFALGVTFVATVACGVFPAFQLVRADLQSSLRSGARGAGTGRPARTLRRALVVGEVALTLVVLVNASLLIRSFRAAQQVVPAFDAHNLLTFEVALPRSAYPTRADVVAMQELLRTRLAELPRRPQLECGVSPPSRRWTVVWLLLPAGPTTSAGRCHPQRAVQRRHARLLQHDGHRPPRWSRVRRHRQRRRRERDDRE